MRSVTLKILQLLAVSLLSLLLLNKINIFSFLSFVPEDYVLDVGITVNFFEHKKALQICSKWLSVGLFYFACVTGFYLVYISFNPHATHAGILCMPLHTLLSYRSACLTASVKMLATMVLSGLAWA